MKRKNRSLSPQISRRRDRDAGRTLRSRFEWGLTVDIQSPDYKPRIAILRKKELEGYNIDNEVIKYIATNVKSNIRELEGALTKIALSG